MDAPSKNGLKPFSMKRILVALVSWAVLVSLSWVWGESLGNRLIPLYQWGFQKATPYYRVKSLRIEQRNGEAMFTLKARTTGNRRIGNKTLANGSSLSSSTLLAHALQPAIVFYLLLMIWPVTLWQHRLWLFILSVPALLIIELVDVPLVLLGALEDVLLFNMDPAALRSSLAVQWMHLMNAGGRLALGIIGFALTLLLGGALARLTRAPEAAVPAKPSPG